MNVLIIEDNPIIAMGIEHTINSLNNLNIFTSSSLEESLLISKENKPHILICDIKLENENVTGVDIAKKLQTIYSSEVVFLTSYWDDETLSIASEVNYSGYILKPYDEDNLLMNLKLLIEKINKKKNDLEYINEEYSFDLNTKKLYRNGELIILTSKEEQLFLLLLNAKGEFVSINIIDEIIWTGEFVNDNTRRQLFHRLRKKTPNLKYNFILHQGYSLDI